MMGQQQTEQEQYNPPIPTAAMYIPATEHQNAAPVGRRVVIFCRALNAVRASHFHETFRGFLADKDLGVFEHVRFRKAPRQRGSLIDFRIRVGYYLVYVDSNVDSNVAFFKKNYRQSNCKIAVRCILGCCSKSSSPPTNLF